MVAPTSPFLWASGGRALTEDEIAREREIADALQASGVDTSPVGHWTQGAARMAQALVGNIREGRADAAAADNADYNSNLVKALIGGGGGSTAMPEPTGAAPVIPVQTGDIPMPGAAGELAATTPGGPQSYRDAIASIESAGSGDYAAVGPTHPKLGRALGRYQIMEANIGPWSQAALGRAVTPDEFMASPEIQDAIFDNQFGQYVAKYGPEKAAQAWIGGEGGIGTNRRDSLGTSVGAYGQKFMNALGEAEGQPVQVAGGGGRMGDFGELNPGILQALTDPRASAGTQRIAMALYQDQQAQQRAASEALAQQADPRYQLGLRKLQAEVNALENPVAQIPDSVQALELRAERAGLQKGTPEYNNFMLTGGDRGLTINNEGAIPAGMQAVRDANQRIIRYEPIPGSPQAMEAEAAANKQTRQEGSRETASQVVTDAATRALDAMNAPGMSTTGLTGRAMSLLPASNAAEVRRQVDVLKSNATVETLNAMRQASPTGGALGSVTEKEGAMLAAKSGTLDPDSPNFERDLKDYLRTQLEIIHGPDAGREIFNGIKWGNQTTGGLPDGVTQEEWDEMTDSQKRLFQ